MSALPKNETPLAGGARKSKHIAVDQRRQFISKSTSTRAQRERILQALRAGPKTSLDLRRLGIYQHSVRIFELREAGYDIKTVYVTLVDHDGYEHRRCGRYELVAEPVPGKGGVHGN